jgi:hypothetical protein
MNNETPRKPAPWAVVSCPTCSAIEGKKCMDTDKAFDSDNPDIPTLKYPHPARVVKAIQVTIH